LADVSICIIDGCGKREKYNGMCSMHAERVRKHGSPEKGAFRPKGKCILDGCENTHYGQGYCLKHYKRWSKYGDPLAGGLEWGTAQKYLYEVAGTTGTKECIRWPFGYNSTGYGRVSWKSKACNAHAVVCEIAHGPKPTPKHECCHRCGQGHLGCVNPDHLYWGTRSDNMQDALRHGTRANSNYLRGEQSPKSKFPQSTIDAARLALSRGEQQKAVASRFGLSQSHVSRIKHGKR